MFSYKYVLSSIITSKQISEYRKRIREAFQQPLDEGGDANHGTTHYSLGTFLVKNIGTDPEGLSDSYLDWAIAEIPDWGNNWVFAPNGGVNLPSGDQVTVQVYVDVPDEQGTYTGSVKIWNTENHANYGIISVQLIAPVKKTTLQSNLFWKGFYSSLSKDILSSFLIHFLR